MIRFASQMEADSATEHSRTLLGDIYSDYRRYRATGTRTWIGVVLFTQGFWASAIYRICHELIRFRQVTILGPLWNLVCVAGQKASEMLTGICLPADCEIGQGLYIAHFGPTILNGAVRIGNNCNLAQGVTIGVAGRGDKRGAPVIGNRVFIGPNALVFGPISVGDDVAIGAGAVVTKCLPAFAVAVGNPARVISYEGSVNFVQFDGMDSHPGRRREPTPMANGCDDGILLPPSDGLSQ